MDAWGDLGRERVAWGSLSAAEAGADRGGRCLVEAGEDTGEIKRVVETATIDGLTPFKRGLRSGDLM